MSQSSDPRERSEHQRAGSAYAKAGVDIEAGDRAVKLMSQSVKATHRPEVVGGIGGFAGLFDASAFKNYRRPLLATSTDGVGCLLYTSPSPRDRTRYRMPSSA